MAIVESQFIPGADSGAVSRSLIQGLNTGQSLAERGQEMRLRQAEDDRKTMLEKRQDAEWAVLAPVRAAKMQADIAQGKAMVDGLQQSETMRQQANEILPQARSDFNNMMKLSDPDVREQAGLDWVGKYGQLANVGAFSKEFENYKDIVAKNHSDASALRLLARKSQDEKDLMMLKGENELAVAGVKADTAKETTQIKADTSVANTTARTGAMTDVAGIKAGATTDAATIHAGATTEAAKTHAAATVKSAEIRSKPKVLTLLDSLQDAKDNNADPEIIQDIRDSISKEHGVTKDKLFELERYKELHDKAVARGDQITATLWQKAIDKKTHQTKSTADVLSEALNPQGAPSAAPAAGQAPATPAATPPLVGKALHDFFFGGEKKK